MPRRSPAPPLLALALLVLTACEGPGRVPPPPPPAEPGPPAYAAFTRARERNLRQGLQELVDATRPLVLEVRGQLERRVAEFTPPLRFATKEPRLRRWGEELQQDFQAVIELAYRGAHERLAALYESAMDEGIRLAQSMAPARSPLDAGPTGSPMLDAAVDAFEQSLDGLFDFTGLELRQQQDVLRRVELIELFTSFSVPGVDERLGGRLLLFVGGDERSPEPTARVVLRCADGVDPADRRFFQVARHRVMRGPTIVHDTGWRAHAAGDGAPLREVSGNYLLGAGIAPTLRTELPGFEALQDMRVLVDLQTAVLDGEDTVLGGVDWRIEFRVTMRGDVSWQVGDAVPLFDPTCPETVAVLARRRS